MLDKIVTFIGYLLFFLMLVIPRTYMWTKMVLLPIVLVGMLFKIYFSQKIYFDKYIGRWFLCFLIYGLVWSIIGVLYSNPGVMDMFRINVAWVLLYAIIVIGINNNETINNLSRILIIASFFIAYINLSNALVFLGYIPDAFLITMETYQAVGVHEGYMQLADQNIGSLAFVLPFLLSLFLSGSSFQSIIKSKYISIALVLVITVVALSGRRALWIGTILVFVIYFFEAYYLRCFLPFKKISKRVSIFSVIIIGIISSLYWVSDFSVNDTIQWVVMAFDNTNSSGDVRLLQQEALINGFLQSPLLGSGFGVGAPDFIRVYDEPWIYELSYHTILYNTGLLGTSLYMSCLLFIFLYGLYVVKRCKNIVLLALLNGMIGFLFANATNPYFMSYDFMWTLYLPIAAINVCQRQEHRNT